MKIGYNHMLSYKLLHARKLSGSSFKREKQKLTVLNELNNKVLIFQYNTVILINHILIIID